MGYATPHRCSRVTVCAGVALLVGLIAPGPSSAAVGDIAPQDCIEDNDKSFPIGCAGTADGYLGLGGFAISADGKSVYAVGGLDDSLIHASRNTATGALTPVSCISDNDDPGEDGCGVSVDGLSIPRDVAVSPDGKQVYATGLGDGTVVVFNRNTTTGALTWAACFDRPGGPEACSAEVTGLAGAYSVAISPDGKSVYVAARFDDAVVRFDRNTASGALTPKGCISDDDTGAACGQSSPGLEEVGSPDSIAVSPDGKSVYVAAADDSAIAMFARETGGSPADTGALTPLGCIDDNDSGPDTCANSTDALGRAQGLVVSPDGKSVYVASGQTAGTSGELPDSDHAIVRFDRNAATGLLTPAGCIDDPAQGPEPCAQTAPLWGVGGLAISPDGRSLYAANDNNSSSAIVHFSRSAAGTLGFVECVAWIDPAVPCAKASFWALGASLLLVEPGGEDVYAASLGSGLIGHLRRGDVTPPNTQISAGPGEGTTTNDDTPSFSFASTEAGSTLACRLDPAAFAACTSPKTFGPLADGTYAFRARATDESGNTDPSPAVRTFTVDTVLEGGFSSAAGTQRVKPRRPKVGLDATCGEACDVGASGKVVIKGGRKRRAGTTATRLKLKPAAARLNAAGEANLFLKPKGNRAKKTLKKALLAKATVKAKLSVTITDDAGNSQNTPHTVKLKAR